MVFYDVIGYMGVLIASSALLPQIKQILKTKTVRDLNRSYFTLCILSEFLYITYGLGKEDYVMVASTIPPMITQMFVIYLHCRYKNAKITNVNSDYINDNSEVEIQKIEI